MAGRAPIYSLSDVQVMRNAGTNGFALNIPKLSLEKGEIWAVCAGSGSGKSTLLEALAFALRPELKGTFAFSPEMPGHNIIELWRRTRLDSLTQLRGAFIGFVLQTGRLLPFLTVRENIAFPARLFGKTDADANRRAEELAERLGIDYCIDRLPSRLSVGEQQRAAVARALAADPAVVLADEPTASLDPINAEEVFRLMVDLVRDAGMAAIIATHEWERVGKMGIPVLNHKIAREDKRIVSHFWT